MIFAVDNLRFGYNSHPVLAGVTFTLEKGRLLGVLGVNGAGKSTLLKCLNRILKPQSGTVLLAGTDLLAMQRSEIARRIGYVPQKSAETNLTVFESVLLGRKPHIRWSAADEDYAVVENVLRQMGLEPLALRPVSELSGGEAQKVLLARALAQTPRVLLLDEPTSNLDVKNQLEVMGRIREVVKSEQLAAVISIHDLNLAVRFADDFVLLKDRRIRHATSRQGLTEEMIGEVYGIDVVIREVGGHPVVVPL